MSRAPSWLVTGWERPRSDGAQVGEVRFEQFLLLDPMVAEEAVGPQRLVHETQAAAGDLLPARTEGMDVSVGGEVRDKGAVRRESFAQHDQLLEVSAVRDEVVLEKESRLESQFVESSFLRAENVESDSRIDRPG